MSIQSEIERISDNVAAAYAAVEEMGGTVPEAQNSDGLAEAVRSIPTGGGIPSGCILIWSGAESAIPSGWALCDGENGTPDLRDRFVLGAGTAHSVGDTGGSEEVTLTVAQMPKHTHFWQAFASGSTSVRGIVYSDTINLGVQFRNSPAETGSSQPHPNMPPYYALCYIMKL